MNFINHIVFLVSAFLSVETPGWVKRWGARHGKKEAVDY